MRMVYKHFIFVLLILQLNESGILTRLIPGLDGRLYQFDGEVIEPLPLSADNLLDSSLRFHENSFIVGGKELSSIGLDPDNGQVSNKIFSFCHVICKMLYFSVINLQFKWLKATFKFVKCMCVFAGTIYM